MKLPSGTLVTLINPNYPGHVEVGTLVDEATPGHYGTHTIIQSGGHRFRNEGVVERYTADSHVPIGFGLGAL